MIFSRIGVDSSENSSATESKTASLSSRGVSDMVGAFSWGFVDVVCILDIGASFYASGLMQGITQGKGRMPRAGSVRLRDDVQRNR
jgi:hypothetical protein